MGCWFGSFSTACRLSSRARLMRANALAELPMMACDRAMARCLCVLVSHWPFPFTPPNVEKEVVLT